MIYNEDAVKWANEYTGEKFHALLCDAPYHLTSIVKRFGKKDSALVRVDEFFDGNGKSKGSSPYSRTSKGFMGQTWDGGDVAFRAETWEAICEHLYPGGFGMVFSASRNWHRLAVAIEDAGMIIHPTIFGWLNGQGFPKATRIDKKVEYHDGSQNWTGHRYGLQALKPAVEPIIVFQKPYEGRPLDDIVTTGAGALNIDGARIPLNGDSYVINTFDDGAKPWGDGAGHKFTSRKIEVLSNHSRSAKASKSKGIYGDSKEQETHQTDGQKIGRWPANFILDESVAPLLDKQTGNRKTTWISPEHKNNRSGDFLGQLGHPEEQGYNDNGGASRFFYNVQEQINEADPIYYCGKVGKVERNAGLDDEPEKELGHSKYDKCSNCGGYIFQSEGRNSKCLCENPIRVSNTQKNNHPTMKPIALAKYLATLLLPPDGYAPRRILVPFSGVGSEMIGAYLAGWEEVVGVEFDTENGYVDIAKKRIQHWTGKEE